MPISDTSSSLSTAKSIPAGPSWKLLASLLITGLAMLVIGVVFAGPVRHAAQRASEVWLERRPAAASTQPGQPAAYYTCGMHPWVIVPHPGDCPICQMKLVPLDPSKLTGEITIDPAITQNIGVRTATARQGPLIQDIQATGSITWDETALHEITLKYEGWIEKLHVDIVGQPVKKGQLLFEVYAPAVYVAQEEYLRFLRRPANERGPEAAQQLAGARRRLEYLDLTPEQIKELEVHGASQKTIAVYSPADGVVVERNITQGAAVQPGPALLRIADTSRVWVMASLYEQQLPLIHEQMEADMTLSYLPGKTFHGQLAYLYPYLNNTSRQASARLVFDNPDGLLKPGMFANVHIHAQLDDNAVLIPQAAVIDTGLRQIAFVALGKGRFEPRTLTLGVQGQGDMVQVLDGIAAGERIVTSGQFLLDSESSIRQALAQMIAPPATSQPAAPAAMQPVPPAHSHGSHP